MKKNELKQIRNAKKSLKKAALKRAERTTPHPVGFEYAGVRK